MQSANPVVIDGETYQYLNLNLAVTYRMTGDGTSDASVAMRIIPARYDQGTGEVVTADDAATGISVASVDGVDPDAATAVEAVKTAIQNYLTAKGI